MSQTPANRLLVCATCERPEGQTARQDCARLREILQKAGRDKEIAVEAVSCLGGCTAPLNIGLQGQGRASYVMGDVSVADFEAEIVTWCELYLDLPQGWIEDARPLGKLRYNLRARIPAL